MKRRFFIHTILLLIISANAIADAKPVESLIELRQKHVILQKWDLSCGAATLATLFNYQHGESVTEKEVATFLMKRKEYIDNPQLVSIRQGFSLFDLKRFTEYKGYKGTGFGKLEFDDLVKKAPIIVPINIHGYNHFVIFRGTLGNRVLLSDPAWGNRTLLIDEFEELRIDFPVIGKVGFIVEQQDQSPTFHALTPTPRDYVMVR
jgi:uncharacterized protein